MLGYTSREGYLGLPSYEHHQSRVRDVPSVLGQPGTSKVVPNMVFESIMGIDDALTDHVGNNLGCPRS